MENEETKATRIILEGIEAGLFPEYGYVLTPKGRLSLELIKVHPELTPQEISDMADAIMSDLAG